MLHKVGGLVLCVCVYVCKGEGRVKGKLSEGEGGESRACGEAGVRLVMHTVVLPRASYIQWWLVMHTMVLPMASYIQWAWRYSYMVTKPP